MKKTLKTIAAALLTCAALGLQAAPLLATQLVTDAVAVAGAAAEVDSKSSPPDGLPLISPAVAQSGANYASALGFADNGLLVAQSEASSVDQVTSGVATASFDSTFDLSGPGSLKFWINLFDQDFTDAGQFSDASLFLRLVFAGTTYVDLLLTGADDPFVLGVDLPSAGSGTVSLLLVSEANAFGGDASNFVQAEFRIALAEVPEPGTLALLLGAGLVGWVARPRRGVRALTAA